jgi:hypothetical protein
MRSIDTDFDALVSSNKSVQLTTNSGESRSCLKQGATAIVTYSHVPVPMPSLIIVDCRRLITDN